MLIYSCTHFKFFSLSTSRGKSWRSESTKVSIFYRKYYRSTTFLSLEWPTINFHAIFSVSSTSLVSPSFSFRSRVGFCWAEGGENDMGRNAMGVKKHTIISKIDSLVLFALQDVSLPLSSSLFFSHGVHGFCRNFWTVRAKKRNAFFPFLATVKLFHYYLVKSRWHAASGYSLKITHETFKMRLFCCVASFSDVLMNLLLPILIVVTFTTNFASFLTFSFTPSPSYSAVVSIVHRELGELECYKLLLGNEIEAPHCEANKTGLIFTETISHKWKSWITSKFQLINFHFDWIFSQFQFVFHSKFSK